MNGDNYLTEKKIAISQLYSFTFEPLRSGFIIKAVIFYFSGTGNTWWVTNEIVEELKQKGWEVTSYSIESPKVKKETIEQLINDADLVGFGYPIYGSTLPDNFQAFIRKLSKRTDKKPAFVFTTMLIFSGDGALVAARRLKRKGFLVKQANNIRMPTNIYLPIFPLLPVTNEEEEITKIKTRAKRKIAKVVKRIVEGKKWREGWDPINVAGGLMQRIPEPLFIKWFARLLEVDEELCTKCQKCVRNCPVNNITLENEKITFGLDCNACMRCYSFCPEEAILIGKGTRKRQKYQRYKGPGDGFKPEILKK